MPPATTQHPALATVLAHLTHDESDPNAKPPEAWVPFWESATSDPQSLPPGRLRKRVVCDGRGVVVGHASGDIEVRFVGPVPWTVVPARSYPDGRNDDGSVKMVDVPAHRISPREALERLYEHGLYPWAPGDPAGPMWWVDNAMCLECVGKGSVKRTATTGPDRVRFDEMARGLDRFSFEIGVTEIACDRCQGSGSILGERDSPRSVADVVHVTSLGAESLRRIDELAREAARAVVTHPIDPATLRTVWRPVVAASFDMSLARSPYNDPILFRIARSVRYGGGAAEATSAVDPKPFDDLGALGVCVIDLVGDYARNVVVAVPYA